MHYLTLHNNNTAPAFTSGQVLKVKYVLEINAVNFPNKKTKQKNKLGEHATVINWLSILHIVCALEQQLITPLAAYPGNKHAVWTAAHATLPRQSTVGLGVGAPVCAENTGKGKGNERERNICILHHKNEEISYFSYENEKSQPLHFCLFKER